MTRVKPFVKWAGGKTQLLGELLKRLPIEMQKGEVEKYIEPFVGGGTLFFSIARQYKIDEYIINDKNEALMTTYEVIKEDVENLIQELSRFEEKYFSLTGIDRTNFYYRNRSTFNHLRKTNKSKDKIYMASLFIFLNKTCYNGLFRLNKNGEFNVPVGSNHKKIYNETNLRSANKILQSVEILKQDFKSFFNDLKDIGSNCFVYVDPPYTVKHGNNGFLMYNEKIFSWEDQVELASLITKFSSKGAKIMISNAKHGDIINLYRPKHFYSHVVRRSSLISGKSSVRGPVLEHIFTTYKVNENDIRGKPWNQY